MMRFSEPLRHEAVKGLTHGITFTATEHFLGCRVEEHDALTLIKGGDPNVSGGCLISIYASAALLSAPIQMSKAAICARCYGKM